MNKILSAKHWQIFVFLMIGLFIGNLKIENEPTLTVILTIIGILAYSIYPLLVGHFLQDYLPRRMELNHNLFLINVFIWISVYSVIMVLSDGKGMTFNGIIALPFLYVFYALLYSLAFPAKTLKSIELNKKASFGEYFVDFILIIFLPIGIWVLQPRINKIVKSEE